MQHRVHVPATGNLGQILSENEVGLAHDSDLKKTLSPRQNQRESLEDLKCERMDVPRLKLFTREVART